MNNNLNLFSVKQMFNTLLVSLMAITLLTGCDSSDQSSKSNSPINKVVKKYRKAVILTGLVSNQEGPITAGKIEVADNKGAIVITTEWKNSEPYAIDIPAGTTLPIVLTAYPEAKQNNGDTLIVAVINPTLKKYDINQLTTTIAKKAKSMGGYTYENMSQAAMTSTAIPDANKTSGGFRGDPTSQYGGWH